MTTDPTDPTGTVPAASDAVGADADSADLEPVGATPADAAPERDAAQHTLMAQMGGPMGMVDSGLPVVVFVIVNVMAGLTPAIIAALGSGVVIALLRLVRRKPVTQAIGGLFAVGIAAYIAHRTGSARGYFLMGIWTQALYGGALLLSIIVRWPLIGVIWEGLNGRGMAWRANVSLRHRYDAATAVWVAVFAVRFVVQQWLYTQGDEVIGWLAAARLGMGYPLFLAAIVATIAIVGTASGTRLRDLLRKAVGRHA